MLSDSIIAAAAKARQESFWQEAEELRLSKMSRAPRRRIQDKLLLTFGQVLILAGIRLQGRCKAVVPHKPGAFQLGS